MTIRNQDPELLIPLPHGMRRKTSPEMVIPDHDFGPKIGVHDAISLRDLWLIMDITPEKMREIDAARAANGLGPMFKDPEDVA